MFIGISHNRVVIAALASALLLIMPAAAINVAVYGDTAGFVPDQHRDTFTIMFSLPGISGVDLDSNVSHFTNSSIDVIFMDGGESFSPGTAAKIEDAVASGKILVIADTHYRNFAASVPVENVGTVPGSPSVQVTDPNTTFSQDIFAGLRTSYPNSTPVTDRAQFVAKTDAVTLISFSNGDPALVYGSYGNGYVVAWTPSSIAPYLSGTEADRINERLITHLLALRRQVPVTTIVTPAISPNVTTVLPTAFLTPAIPTVSQPNATTPSNVTTTVPVSPASGNVSVYSSPMGANVFIDGVYRGVTPVNLTGITPGYHALKLAMNGYYDHDSIIYVVETGTITAFGTLPPRETNTVQVTQTPAPPTTVNASVTAVPTSIWESPGVIAALLGVLTAIIGAAATLFSIYHKHKKT